MYRSLWVVVVSCCVSLLLGCPSDSGPEEEERELEGSWRHSEGTIIVIDGSTGTLIAFPPGAVFGREIFDVGDEYLRAIERTGTNRFEAELAVFDTDDGVEWLAIEGVGYEACTLELTGEDSMTVTLEDGSTMYFSRDSATLQRHGGACEGQFFSLSKPNNNYYVCSDAFADWECSYEALGHSSVLKVPAEFEFSEGKTCPELGYTDRFDEPALYQYAQGNDWTPGASGHWGDLVSTDAGVPDPDDAGMQDASVIDPPADAAVDAVQYLIFGTAWDHATIDCPEGSATFDDWQSYAWQIVDGEWSDTYSEASAALKAKLMSDAPGARAYYVESSWFDYGREASHAVVIEYTQQLFAWDCRPQLITIGYGKTYEEALEQALETKANNDSESAPYTELEHMTWQP